MEGLWFPRIYAGPNLGLLEYESRTTILHTPDWTPWMRRHRGVCLATSVA